MILGIQAIYTSLRYVKIEPDEKKKIYKIATLLNINDNNYKKQKNKHW